MTIASSNYTCKCGSERRRTVLSAPRPLCRECGDGICWSCDQVKCWRCGDRMHAGCTVLYGEDQFCTKCAAVELELDRKATELEVIESLTLEERLVASVAVAQHRKGAAACIGEAAAAGYKVICIDSRDRAGDVRPSATNLQARIEVLEAKCGAAVEALKRVREIGYGASFQKSSDAVIACIVAAEEGIAKLEGK